jgi:hypothetical protein
MARPRAADDFAAIRARMEELRRQRLQAQRDKELDISADRHPPSGSAWTGSIDKPEVRPSRVRYP